MMYSKVNKALSLLMLLIGLIRCENKQNFVQKPSDVKVNLGETALLKCSVSARHGDVQWIHDGTALGYDRKVPGKPRYSVIWTENEDTEYHLQIANVTLDDEGTFACQVAPIGDWDTKLEAKAKIRVLIPPKHVPDIMFNDESKNSNDIVHFKSASVKQTSKFTCRVRKAKPAATIKWYLNDTLAGANVGKSSDVKQSDGHFEDVISTFELKPQTNAIFNNSMIKCQAFHDSYGSDTQLKNLSIALRVVVVYPPSVPIIKGYDSEEEGIVAGSELNLRCESSHSYPPAQLSWYRDGKLVSRNYETIEATKTSESVFKIAKVLPADNKIVYKCNSMNQAMDEPLSSNVTLNVLYGPEKLTMNGEFEVEAGKQISAVCFSEPANPSPTLRFNFGGVDYEPSAFASTPTAASVATGAFIVNGTFSHTVKQDDNNKELKCYVENKAANVQQIVTKQIKVLYPPDYLEMRHQIDNKVINEGTKIRVVCLSRGGNPLPEIEWYLDNKKLTPHSSQSVVYTVESVLDLILQREHHNKVLECRTVNKIGSIKKEVTLNVSYMPSSVIISSIEPFVNVSSKNQLTSIAVKSGTKVIVSCRAPDSNPQPFITWFKDGYPILFNSEEEQNLTSVFVNNKEYETTSYMSFIASSGDHLKEIRCDVKVKDLPRTMHGSVTLEVKFPPEIIKYPTSVIDVVENAQFSLNLSARANPAPDYKCSSSNNKKYSVANATLNFTASRSDMGDFICSISNSESQTDVSFKINVKYAPTAKINATSQIVVSRGDKAQIFCLIDANPLHSSHVTWKLNNKQIVNDDYYHIRFIGPNLSVLTITKARDSDDGQVICHASNSIGNASVAHVDLRVKRTPQIMIDSSQLKAGEDSNMGRSAQFKCQAKSYPEASFKWKKADSNNNELTNSTNYTILNVKNESTQTYTSTLTIHTIVSSNYGTYLCEVRNEVGSTLAKAVLSGKHQPEKPSEFRVVNITKNSISLAWKPSFDGGDAQKFLIRYRKDTLDPTYKYIETELGASAVLLDNLDPATRYVINIQALNKFGTDGFLRDPLIVQTDFGFNEINQMPIFNQNSINDFPLTVILIICSSGTLFMLLNVGFIVYLIRKRKRKGEADSTTDTNETEANTVEMFSPPPPYPDELNYHFDINGFENGMEEEHKPFMQTLKHQKYNNHHQHTLTKHSGHHLSNKYFSDMNDQLDYAIEYATPIHHNNNLIDPTISGGEMMLMNEDNDVYLASLRQLDKNLTAAAAAMQHNQLNNTSIVRSSFNPNNNNNLNRSNFNLNNKTSFHNNLNNLTSSFINDTSSSAASTAKSSLTNNTFLNNFQDTLTSNNRPFPYDTIMSNSRSRLNNNNNNSSIRPIIKSSQTNINLLNQNPNSFRTNSTCKIYSDLSDLNKKTLNRDFKTSKGHLV